MMFFFLVFAANAIGLDWGQWQLVDGLDKDLSQVAISIDDGKVGIAYRQNVVSGNDGKLRYSQYVYSDLGIGLVAQDEDVPNSQAYWGTNIKGIDFDSNGNAVIAVVPEADGTNARVLTRNSAESYSYENADDASTRAYSSRGGTNEAFGIDSNGDMHFVWGSVISDSNSIVYAKKSGGSWSRSTMVTSDAYTFIKPALALDTSNNYHISYIDANGTTSFFYTDDMSSNEYVGYNGVGYPGSYSDIEVAPNGYPMVAHMDLSASGIVVRMYNGSSWDQTTVVSSIDARDYGWYGVGAYLDLEVNGDGNAVILLASTDYTAGTADIELDYYTYNGSSWGSAEQIGSFEGNGSSCAGLDLEFDDEGRPFVAVLAKQSPSGYADALLLTTEFPVADSNMGSWGSWELVDRIEGINLTKPVVAAKDGRIGIAYYQSTNPYLYYSEYLYNDAGQTSFTRDEAIPGGMGQWGAHMAGICFDPEGYVRIATLPYYDDTALQLITRYAYGVYIPVKILMMAIQLAITAAA